MNMVLAMAAAGMATAPTAEAPVDTVASNFNLDEVVVTATRAPKLLKDTPVQTRLITSRDIARTDATDVKDLLQQEMPGLEFSYAMNQQVHLNFNGQEDRASSSWWMANAWRGRRWTMWTSRD